MILMVMVMIAMMTPIGISPEQDIDSLLASEQKEGRETLSR